MKRLFLAGTLTLQLGNCCTASLVYVLDRMPETASVQAGNEFSDTSPSGGVFPDWDRSVSASDFAGFGDANTQLMASGDLLAPFELVPPDTATVQSQTLFEYFTSSGFPMLRAPGFFSSEIQLRIATFQDDSSFYPAITDPSEFQRPDIAYTFDLDVVAPGPFSSDFQTTLFILDYVTGDSFLEENLIGSGTHSFSGVLPMGNYLIGLQASSSFDETQLPDADDFFGATVDFSGAFTLTAVPEANESLVALLGITGMIWGIRRRKPIVS